jgi:hypothetical protein
VAVRAPDGSSQGSTGVILWPKRARAISMTVRARGRTGWKHAKSTKSTSHVCWHVAFQGRLLGILVAWPG